MRAPRLSLLRALRAVLLGAALVGFLAPAALADHEGRTMHASPLEGRPQGPPGPVVMFFSSDADPGKGGLRMLVVAGEPTKVWVHVFATGADVNDTVRFEMAGAVLNVSEAAVRVRAGEFASIPIEVTARPQGRSMLTAVAVFDELRDAAGNPMRVDADVPVLPVVSVRLVNPAVVVSRDGPVSMVESIHVGRTETIAFTVRATNVGSRTSEPHVVGLWADGSLLGEATIPALGPRESQDVVVKRFRIDDDMPGRLGRGMTMMDVGFHLASPGGQEPVYGFDFVDGVVRDARFDHVRVAFYTGLLAKAEDVNLTLGKPSRVALSVRNFGDSTARGVRIDVTIMPQPVAYFGPGSYLKETRYVTVAPGAEERIELTFTPRVAANHVVEVTPHLDSWSPSITTTARIDSPVMITFRGVQGGFLRMGETATLPFLVDSTIPLDGAEARVAVTREYTRDIPFVRFLQADDVFDASLAPSRLTIEPGTPAWLNVSAKAKSAGSFLVVPYILKDGIAYVGAGSNMPGAGPIEIHRNPDGAVMSMDGPMPLDSMRPGSGGSVGVATVVVTADGIPVALAWGPFAMLVLGFAAHRIHRWRFVR